MDHTNDLGLGNANFISKISVVKKSLKKRQESPVMIYHEVRYFVKRNLLLVTLLLITFTLFIYFLIKTVVATLLLFT